MSEGWRLSDLGSALSWWDFQVWTENRPAGSILWRAIHGPYYPYEVRLLGWVVQLLRNANWQRSATQYTPKPQLIKFPWSANSDETTTYGKPRPLEDVRAYLLALNGRAPE